MQESWKPVRVVLRKNDPLSKFAIPVRNMEDAKAIRRAFAGADFQALDLQGIVTVPEQSIIPVPDLSEFPTAKEKAERHLDACLRADDMNNVDLALARGWQLGIVADGILRNRPRPMPVPDYSASDNLFEKVRDDFAETDSETLLKKMRQRAGDWFGT